MYTYNFLGLRRFTVGATSALPIGKATIGYKFASDGPGMGKGGNGTIFVNGQKVAEGRIDHTQCCGFSGDEGADAGMDEGTPVTEDYKEGNNKFTGKIHSVTVELKEIGELHAWFNKNGTPYSCVHHCFGCDDERLCGRSGREQG